MKHHSSSLSDIDSIGHIPEEKKSLNPTKGRMIGSDKFREIISDLYETLRKGESCFRLDDTIFNHSDHTALFLEESISYRCCSRVNSEDDHRVKYMHNPHSSPLSPQPSTLICVESEGDSL